MQASPAEHRSYLWAVQGKRIAVDVPLGVVDRLRDVIAEGLETDGRGIEVGGLLFGRTRRADGQLVVEIEDFETIECEHLAGPSLMLSAGDRHALEARLRRRRAGGAAIAGFFRSNTRKESGATIEDVALMSTYFSDPAQVFLLVQADRSFPPTAGFLIWEGRTIRSPRPYLEFPFSADDLAGYAHTSNVPAPVVEIPAPPRAPRRSFALVKLLPPNARLVAGWVAAAAVVMAVSAGVMYDESRKAPAASDRPAAIAASSKPAPPVAAPPAPAPEPAPAETAAAPAPVAEAEPQVAHPAPPVDVPGLPKSAPAQPPVAAAPEPSKPVAVASAGAADRRISPGPPVRAPFVAPPLPRPATTADLADPPELDARPAAGEPSHIDDLAVSLRPPSRPAPPPFVSVAADPLVGRRGRSAKTVLPAPLRRSLPDVPADVRNRLRTPVLINVKVYLDRSGKVEFAELLSDGTGANRDLATMAVFSARRWQFSPASVDGTPAASEVVLRYRFGPETR